MLKSQWQDRIHHQIPITKAMGVCIEQLDCKEILVSAPLANNINLHNTAFAGSIYTLGIVAGWTLISAYLEQAKIKAKVVASEANIKYMKPINSNLLAQCLFTDSAPITQWQPDLSKDRRAIKQELIVDIRNQELIAAQLSATFYIKPLPE